MDPYSVILRDAGFDRRWRSGWCFPGMKLALCGCRLESRLVNSPVLLLEKRREGAPCIMVLAREVWSCVHKLNYFNLREEGAREGERIMERVAVGVCVAFTCDHMHVCRWKEERETHFYSSLGLTFTTENINRVAGDYRRGQMLPCSWKL